jgi:hypothetical protein
MVQSGGLSAHPLGRKASEHWLESAGQIEHLCQASSGAGTITYEA